MTRINAGIEPLELIDQHLIAELHELPRIFTLVQNRIDKDSLGSVDIPPSFRLGSGHVTFFYNKLLYLKKRHDALRAEYTRRFEKEWPFVATRAVIPTLSYTWNDWTARAEDRELLLERINERISNMKTTPRYASVALT